MADVSGPISSLPGAVRKSPNGYHCDTHEDRPAVYRVQGETDSFGCEWHDMCQECYDAYQKEDPYEDWECEHCNSKESVGPWRDPDEGMAGPVYYICAPCRIKRNRYHQDVYDDE